MSTFNKLMAEEEPSLFFVEETKFTTEGKMKLKNYKVFENVRQNMGGGGILRLKSYLGEGWGSRCRCIIYSS